MVPWRVGPIRGLRRCGWMAEVGVGLHKRSHQSPRDSPGLAQNPSPGPSTWMTLSGVPQAVGGAGGGKVEASRYRKQGLMGACFQGFSRKTCFRPCPSLLSLCPSGLTRFPGPAFVMGGQSTWTDSPGAAPG